MYRQPNQRLCKSQWRNPSDLEPGDAGKAANSVEAVRSIEIVDECLVVDICVDRYLWALYQRTPKEDTIKELERRNVTVKRKGKMVTVARTFTKLVDEDFGWKDPKAAERAGMSVMDYVIGGMDRSFKLKLFHILHAAEAAGLSPGITSAFRDDYRQIDRKRPQGGEQQVVSWRELPRWLWAWAGGRYRECPGRNSRPAMGIFRKALEVG